MPAGRNHPGSPDRMTRFLRIVAAVFAVAFLAPLPVAAQDAAPPSTRSSFPIFFDFFGTWRGEGVVATWPSKIEMTWAPIIDGRFIRVTWKNDMISKSGDPQRFEGEGTYRPMPDADNNHTGTWFDSQGMTYPLYGRVAGDSLTTNWGNEGGMQGRTTYRLVDRNTMRVRDEVRRDGKWNNFGVSTLVRQPVKAASSTD